MGHMASLRKHIVMFTSRTMEISHNVISQWFTNVASRVGEQAYVRSSTVLTTVLTLLYQLQSSEYNTCIVVPAPL